MAAPVQPDWIEHAPTLVAVGLATLGGLFTALLVVTKWALGRHEKSMEQRENALGQRITDGFQSLGERIADVATRFDSRLDSTWEELREHRNRIEQVEIRCAGHHAHSRRDDP